MQRLGKESLRDIRSPLGHLATVFAEELGKFRLGWNKSHQDAEPAALASG